MNDLLDSPGLREGTALCQPDNDDSWGEAVTFEADRYPTDFLEAQINQITINLVHAAIAPVGPTTHNDIHELLITKHALERVIAKRRTSAGED